jgi:hypothetical protein
MAPENNSCPPTMGDFIAHGLPLIDALAFEREVNGNPQVENDEWWRRFILLVHPTKMEIDRP